jgi:hypothetical protein
MNLRSDVSTVLCRVTRGGLLGACLSLTSVACVCAPAALWAQAQQERVVQGTVVDGSGAALKNATVYLKDDHSLSVRSYIASDNGAYRFGQLAQGTDYELWAQQGGKKSKTVTLSSFDTRNTFNITLKVDK